MAHLDLYLDKCPGYGWGGAPGFFTKIEQLLNKRARRNAEWSQPLWRFSVIFNNNDPGAYAQVLDMLLLCRGRLHAFRARNWLFYEAVQWKFAVAPGSTTEFQLGRLVEGDGESFLQEVHALSLDPGAPTPTVYIDGVAVDPEDVTFDDRTGKVTFVDAPASDAVLTWSGWFDFWVRFETDDLPATIDNRSGGEFVINYQVNLVETEPADADVPPPEA